MEVLTVFNDDKKSTIEKLQCTIISVFDRSSPNVGGSIHKDMINHNIDGVPVSIVEFRDEIGNSIQSLSWENGALIIEIKAINTKSFGNEDNYLINVYSNIIY